MAEDVNGKCQICFELHRTEEQEFLSTVAFFHQRLTTIQVESEEVRRPIYTPKGTGSGPEFTAAATQIRFV